jgi:hypothetical protein
MSGDPQLQGKADEISAFFAYVKQNQQVEETQDEGLAAGSWLDTDETDEAPASAPAPVPAAPMKRPAPPSMPSMPPPPRPPAGPAAAEVSEEDSPFAPFRKLQRINLPQPAIEQRMRTNGFSEADIKDFFEGKPYAGSDKGSTPPPSARSANDDADAPSSSLLASITAGAKLKATIQRRPESVKAAKYAGSMLLSLASAMSSRRKAIHEDSDSDSDGGFSDDD